MRKVAKFVDHIAVGSWQYEMMLQVLDLHYLFITKFGLKSFADDGHPSSSITKLLKKTLQP